MKKNHSPHALKRLVARRAIAAENRRPRYVKPLVPVFETPEQEAAFIAAEDRLISILKSWLAASTPCPLRPEVDFIPSRQNGAIPVIQYYYKDQEEPVSDVCEFFGSDGMLHSLSRSSRRDVSACREVDRWHADNHHPELQSK